MWKRFTCINGLKACFNYALSHLGVVRFTHRPVFAAIEPANFCQLHCPECPVGLRSHPPLRSNEQEWAWIRRHYRALGADRLVFKTAQFYDFEQGHPLMPSNPKYSRYQLGKDGLYHLRHPVKMPCRRLWMGCVVDALGDVYPCCYDKDRRYPLGNLLTQSLDQVWFGSRADQIRRQWQQKPAEICKNCAG